MSTGDRVTKLYDVFQAGHLTEAEFLALKKEAFLPPPAAAPPINVSIGNASEFAQMQQQLTNIASAVSSLVASRAPAATIEATPALPATKQRTPEVASKKVLLPDQRTLFDCGAKSTIVRADGRKFTVSESQIKAKDVARAGLLQCRWCSRTFSHGPARASHEKTHEGPQRGQFALKEMVAVREQLSEAAQAAEIEKQVRWKLNDLITEMIKIGEAKGDPAFVKFGSKAQDGRKRCRGADVRQGRSPHFKCRVINEYERQVEQSPAFRAEIVNIVADTFSVATNQVYSWVQDGKNIRAKARREKDKHKAHAGHRRGKFHRAEQQVYANFKDMRSKGKRVGPHWMKRNMQREVAELYKGTEFAESVKRFKAGRNWLCRFTKRFNISLRCKTNVKRVPLRDRLGKVQRFVALFRRRLKSDAGKAGYHPVWGLFLPRNRWSLDQVPAGFFAPGRTYEHKGAKRVQIAANEAADNHRECTLQVGLGLCYGILRVAEPSHACLRCASGT